MPPIPEMPELLRGRAFVTIDAAILGSRAFGAEIVQALRDLGPEIDTFDMVAPVALSRLHNDPEEPVPVLSEHRLLQRRCRPRRSTRSWPPPARTPARRC